MMQRDGSVDGDKREFLRGSLLAGTAVVLAPALVLAQESETAYQKARKTSRDLSDKGPSLNEEMVFEFMHKSHFDLKRVKELYSQAPTLINATWDWGGGDFESALGAASHMGNREIALFLLENGARPNLFTATMLGQLEVVKGFIEQYPNLIDCKGPHGLTLLHHAKKGAKQAESVLEYLNSKE